VSATSNDRPNLNALQYRLSGDTPAAIPQQAENEVADTSVL
jgi:hypothetical protein